MIKWHLKFVVTRLTAKDYDVKTHWSFLPTFVHFKYCLKYKIAPEKSAISG